MDTKDPNTIIAMQQKDIDFLKDVLKEVKFSISEISTKIDVYNNTFVRKDDYRSDIQEIKKLFDTKANSEEFDQLKSNFSWVSKAIIGEILTIIGVGVIALITHFTK